MKPPKLTEAQWQTLLDFVEVSEEFAGSDPEMPSHKETESRFDRLLEEAKKVMHH